jgi:hypothetical protein
MDLMGPTQTSSLGGKKYILVIVDDYCRYTWALLLREKSDAFEAAQQLFKKIQIEKNCPIISEKYKFISKINTSVCVHIVLTKIKNAENK